MDKWAAKLSQDALLVLTGLPRGSEFGFDGRLWVLDRFSGVKFLPAGLHFFVFSAAPTSSSSSLPTTDPASTAQGVGARHALLRFFRKSERVVLEWDNAREELKRGPAAGSSTRRRRTTRQAHADVARDTVISEEYLQSLDKSLAAYPADELRDQWAALAGFVTEDTLARVVGLDEQACATCDALVGSSQDEAGAVQGGSSARRTWGKAREDEPEVGEVVDEEGEDGAAAPADSGLLEFVRFDDKRSWPGGAVGADLTRWSKDKSWQLSRVVEEQLGGDPKELLAELQLAFVLFTLVHNYSSLSTYKALFALVCRASTLARPSSRRDAASPYTRDLPADSALPLFASFLSTFLAQVDFLDESFFATQLPSLEQHLDEAVAGVWREVVKRWDAVAKLTTAKFGWDLGVIRGSRAKYLSASGRSKRDEDEVDLEDLEEGEDAPVVLDDDALHDLY
ncbi:uncharacterized protein RHOBADRAFT_54834 [Rhodotorula graminis WP1]|uniref:A1 cistron-splicing factor AAR2 n=1 Tax=Rhodotorula graminis (strain WP1) TaxID=578459 RepID=A0A0N8PZY7_RHOGW|nr:uncharacterized protein RHOBADRAFT_54834 [Rhodotorula graminis WP1]KPV73637.1 hypothetical protein RHOBADRAFT_54834 [Rhodotorula graminis WP1]